jgi:purine-binding chemotaxis protein CheW
MLNVAKFDRLTSPANPEDWLVCRLATRLCALPLENVAETMRPLPIEPLAGMPASVLGLSVIRGQPVPVIEAARLFDETGPEPQRFITIRIGGRLVALAVDSVLGVRSIEAALNDELVPLHRDYDSLTG